MSSRVVAMLLEVSAELFTCAQLITGLPEK
jgi:hypothetical protein